MRTFVRLALVVCQNDIFKGARVFREVRSGRRTTCAHGLNWSTHAPFATDVVRPSIRGLSIGPDFSHDSDPAVTSIVLRNQLFGSRGDNRFSSDRYRNRNHVTDRRPPPFPDVSYEKRHRRCRAGNSTLVKTAAGKCPVAKKIILKIEK